MGDSIDAVKRRRRRRWIVACSLPGYVAFVAFGLMAWMQSSRVDLPEPWLLVIVPFGVISLLSWALAPSLR